MSAPTGHIADEARQTAAWWCLRIAEGPLMPEQQTAFDRWLHADPAHPALFERTVVAWDAVEDRGSSPEMIAMRGDALESVRRANRKRWSGNGGWRRYAALAACLVLFVGAGIWWHLSPDSYRTGVGERRVVALADGSMLSLDASTRVDVRYLGDRRELWLRFGRAKFVVAKDPLRPFSVQAGDRIVVATGTQFSVEQLSGQVRVVLYEGRVAVMDTSRAGAPRPLRVGQRQDIAEQVLTPGREMVIAATQPLARLEAVDAGRSLAWEGGLMEFDNEPLGIAIERVNRYGATKLRVGSAADARIPISGQFQGGDIDAFVEGVTAVFPVRAVRSAEGEILLESTGR
jgi:transmembrane sensor